jgi:hypothetical protein
LGSVTWTAPEQFVANLDAMPAIAVMLSGETTRLMYSNTALTVDAIPVGSSIQGVEIMVRVARTAGTTTFNTVQLFAGGAAYATNAASGTVTSASLTNYTFGGASNKLGIADDADFITNWNNDDMSTCLAVAQSVAGGTVTASNTTLKVYYTEPTPSGSSFAGQLILMLLNLFKRIKNGGFIWRTKRRRRRNHSWNQLRRCVHV